MSTVSLDEFLKPFSAALGHTQVPESVDPFSVDESCQFVIGDAMTQDEVIEKFLLEAGKIGVRVVETTEDALGAAIARTASEMDGSKVLVADVPEVDACGLEAALLAADLEPVRWNAEAGRQEVHLAQDSDVGVTFAFAGIAETGSVMQKTSVGSGRSICTIPASHIAVVRRSMVFARMGNALDALSKSVEGSEMPSNVTVISGPSATADIELVRVVGVHGPVHTAIVLVND